MQVTYTEIAKLVNEIDDSDVDRRAKGPAACGRSRLSAGLGDLTMNDTEKLTLWLGAFRYYCGRMTYAVSDFCDLLRKEWPNLPEHTRSLIRAELEETFERDDKHRPYDHYAPLGADCDRKEWEKVRAIWETPNAELLSGA